MSDPQSDDVERLTPAEEERVARAIRRIEDDLYRAVLARVAKTILIVAAVALGSLALIGWLSWSKLRTVLVEDALAGLQTDDSLRSDFIARLGIDTTGYARLLEMLGGIEARGGANPAGGADLAALQRMLDSLMGEPQEPSSGNRRAPRH